MTSTSECRAAELAAAGFHIIRDGFHDLTAVETEAVLHVIMSDAPNVASVLKAYREKLEAQAAQA